MAITMQASGAATASLTISSGTILGVVPSINDFDFINRLAVASVAFALAVITEDTATTHHDERIAYARQVLANPIGYVQGFIVFVVVADGTTYSTATDQQVADRIAAIWNTLSGV
jgi:hypothetical protein